MHTGIRAARCPSASRPGSHPLATRLLHSALEVAELLIDDVLLPNATASQPPDQLKEVAEVAMLLRMAGRVGDPAITERVTDLGERLAPLARTEAGAQRLLLRPTHAPPLALAHACLTQVGLPDAEYDGRVRRAFEASAAGAMEKVPFRLLDMAWIRHLVVGDGALLDHPVLPLTCLAQGIDLIGVDVEDAYAFSHTLPYATDFGRLPMPHWVDLTRLSETADALIAKALIDDDLDLLGELLMTAPILRLPWSQMQSFGLRVLVDVWMRHPILPGPGIPAATGPEDDRARARRVLGTVYHTSLVGGLLMAVLLSSDSWPLSAPTDPRAPALDLGPCTWRATWDGLTAEEQQTYAVAPWLIQLGTVVQALDLGAVISTLREPVALRAPLEPLRQVMELVGRLSSHGAA